MNIEGKGLTEQQIQCFIDCGFVGPLPRFANELLLNGAVKVVKEIISNPSVHPLHRRYSVHDWHLVSPVIEALVTHPTLVSCLRSLAGQDLVLWRSKICHKRSLETSTGWHGEWGDFDWEEIGNNIPSLGPNCRDKGWWNLTVWIALTDVEIECAPQRFICGSHKKQYRKTMVSMPKYEFWRDLFLECSTVEDIVQRVNNLALVLDVDTSAIFHDYDWVGEPYEEVKTYAMAKFEKMMVKKTFWVNDDDADIVTVPMRKGEFVIFAERTMHCSLVNMSNTERLAMNIRITTTDAEIYSGRHLGDVLDGSNLNISEYTNLLVSGLDLSGGRNKYRQE
ncbi:phytanoyl-CoA dioxygenase family protein [Vibrio lamellibrachiae]|uniref:phytanoyl-CoA dioxygenase family protein n=1 Tax=Vibrio lamellibrachiae TaxID=2910253 RepID=UPI003D10C3BD